LIRSRIISCDHYTPRKNRDAKKATLRSRCGEDLRDSLVGVHRAAEVFHKRLALKKALDKGRRQRGGAAQVKQKPRPRITGEA
jgi:hypothetical protein